MAIPLVSLAVILLILLVLRRLLPPSRPALPLPPSPPADPLIGHVRKLPATADDFPTYFAQLGKAHGDVVCLNFLGNKVIVLNSTCAALELLDKRSALYSDRPRFNIYYLMGWADSLVLMPYGLRFQTHRRMFQQHFNRTATTAYRPIQLREARLVAQSLLEKPEDFENTFTQFAAAVILRVVIGHRIQKNDGYVKLAEEMIERLVEMGSMGITPPDIFPFLLRLPSWFPGTYYANLARKYRKGTREMHEWPYRTIQEQLANGTASASFMATELEALNARKAAQENANSLRGSQGNKWTSSPGNDRFNPTAQDIQGAAGIAYYAGSDTTSSSLSIFVLAMVLHPEVQARAQAELDVALGGKRLPEFSDRESLPYLECLVKETLRWNHPVPLAVPHRVIEDDVYNGMLIPKGAIVIANIRGMTWDESLYPDPTVFDPMRYMPITDGGRGEPDPPSSWGFGRRICPGRYVADASLWIAVATILSTFTISKALDKDGKEITPEVAFNTSAVSRPRPFKCNIRPRSRAAACLVSDADVSDNY